MLCVLILYISGGTYSLKSIPNDRFFEKLFMAILFTLHTVFARNLLRGNRRRKILFVFRFDVWPGTRTLAFASNEPTHYLLDQVPTLMYKINTRNISGVEKLGCYPD